MASIASCEHLRAAVLDDDALDRLCPCCLLALGLESDESAAPGDVSLVPETPGLIGTYRPIARLGEGGMGVVFLAEQLDPIRRRVALKLLKRGLNSVEVLARFESERQALALMNHPGIASVFDAGTTDEGWPYFVMELVAGAPITEYCDRRRLSTRERLELLIEVCDAIQHAHTKGIVHRDIKPQNVLVSGDDESRSPKVIDFGVAKAIEQRLTEKTVFTSLGVMIGTPGYTSPEQADITGLSVDTRSDIYSLGVLAYELLVGAPPFDPHRLRQAGWSEMVRIIREEEPPRPSTRVQAAAIARELRGDLDWILLKALEKDPARRYQTASELAADMRRHLSDEPVVARPPTLGYRVGKAVRRHQGLFLASGAVLLAVLGGLVASTMLYLRSEAARRETRRQLVRLNVATGMRLTEEGDHTVALLWLVEALRLEEDDRRRDAHRHRIASTLGHFPALYRLWTHEAGVQDAVFSPDGQRVATASDDKTARVWSVVTGEAVSPPLQHGAPVRNVAFSPDGTRVVTASADGTARVWDTQSGRSLTTLRHGGSVSRAKFAPDGIRIVTASEDDTAGVWDAATGRELAVVRHAGDVSWVDCSPAGTLLLTASMDATARLWDLDTGLPRTPPLTHEGAILMAAFSADGRKIVTASADRSARVWSAETGAPLTPRLHHQRNPAYFADLSVDGQLVAVAAGDNSIHVWDARTGASHHPPLELNAVPSIARFSPDGLLIVSGDDSGVVRLWRTDYGEAVGAQLHHAGGIRAAIFDRSGRFLLTTGMDGIVRMWDLAATQPIHPYLRALWTGLTPDGRGVGTSGFDPVAPDDEFARIWDAETGDPVTPPLRHGSAVFHAFSADGRRVATASHDHTARVWHALSAEPLAGPLQHPTRVTRVAFSADGDRLVTASGDYFGEAAGGRDANAAHVWDVAAGRELFSPLRHESPVLDATFSPGAGHIITISRDGTARIWSGLTGAPLCPPLRHGGPVNAMAVIPEGGLLATASEDNTLRLWRLPSGDPLVAPRPDFSGISKLRFSPDGSRLASGGRGGVVQIWDAPSGEHLGPPMLHRGLIYGMAFSPDGRWLVTTSLDRKARVWDTETGEPVTPPYAEPGVAWSASFAPDGRRFVTRRVWEFEQDQRPQAELERLAHLLSGLRLTSGAVLSNVSPAELRNAWQGLRQRYPEAFEASPPQRHAWHRYKGELLARGRRWLEAVSHFDRALEIEPPRWMVLVARGRALAELGQWSGATADYGRALDMNPGELEVAYDLSLIRLARGEGAAFAALRKVLADRWAGTKNPDRARWAARAAILAPIDEPALQSLAVKWAGTALEVEPRRAERLALYGAALYRARRLSQAVEALSQAMKGGKGAGEAPVAAAAFLAMAERQIGHPEQARHWLATAQTVLNRPDSRDRPLSWWEREELRVLLKEAKGPSPSSGVELRNE